MERAERRAVAEAAYHESMRLLASSSPSGTVEEDDHLLLASTGSPASSFNTAFVKTAGRSADSVARAIDFFGARHEPFMLRAHGPVADDVADDARARGLVERVSVPAMSLVPVGAIPAAPSGLEILEVDLGAYDEFLRVVGLAFGAPTPETAVAIAGGITPPSLLDEGFRPFVGCVDGKAVASSALLMHATTAGIYCVGTLSDHRGRGIGEAMTWHAVRAGIGAGCDGATLQASTMGEPIYRRMGFETVVDFRQWEGPAPR